MFAEEFSRAHIRQNHTFFNQLVSIIAFSRNNRLNFAVCIKDNARFSGFKINRTAFISRFTQNFIQCVQIIQMFNQLLWVLAPRINLTLNNHLCHFGVGQAGCGMHNTFHKLIAKQFTAWANANIADHAQTIHLRIQGTQAIGKDFRQHWNNFAGEIDRCTA